MELWSQLTTLMVKHQMMKENKRKKPLAAHLKVGCFPSPFHFFFFPFEEYEKQTDDWSVEISYTQVRVCLWQTILSALVHCKEVLSIATMAAQQAITCHTWHPLCFCVYNYRGKWHSSPNKATTTTATFTSYEEDAFTFHSRQAEGDKTLATMNKFTVLMRVILLTTF